MRDLTSGHLYVLLCQRINDRPPLTQVDVSIKLGRVITALGVEPAGHGELGAS